MDGCHLGTGGGQWRPEPPSRRKSWPCGQTLLRSLKNLEGVCRLQSDAISLAPTAAVGNNTGYFLLPQTGNISRRGAWHLSRRWAGLQLLLLLGHLAGDPPALSPRGRALNQTHLRPPEAPPISSAARHSPLYPPFFPPPGSLLPYPTRLCGSCQQNAKCRPLDRPEH